MYYHVPYLSIYHLSRCRSIYQIEIDRRDEDDGDGDGDNQSTMLYVVRHMDVQRCTKRLIG